MCCIFQSIIPHGCLTWTKNCVLHVIWKIYRREPCSKHRPRKSKFIYTLPWFSASIFRKVQPLNTQTLHSVVSSALTKRLTLRWSESTLNVPYRSCKTAWPVSQLESLFLPHFPLEDRHQDSKYKKLPDISKGAFGVICPILDLEANELFALKVLSKSKV